MSVNMTNLAVDLNGYIRQGDAAWVREIIAQGFDINERVYLYGAALHLAVEQEQQGVVRDLLALGVNVNLQMKIGMMEHGYAPLHLAAAKGNVRLCRMLLEAGANINAKTSDGITPLQVILEKASNHPCWATLVKEFLERGADVNAVAKAFYGDSYPSSVWGGENKECTRITPLHVALINSEYLCNRRNDQSGFKATAMLMEYGANPSLVPDGVSPPYLTALQLAVKKAPAADVEVLINSAHADIAQKTLSGKTLLSLCGKRAEVKALVMAAKTDLAVRDALSEPNEVKGPKIKRSAGMAAL